VHDEVVGEAQRGWVGRGGGHVEPVAVDIGGDRER
jgi:hypothetical protein